MSYFNVKKVKSTIETNGATHDSFGRLRTSQPVALISDRGLFDNQSIWSSAVNGAGASVDTTNSANSSMINLTVGTASGEYVYRQSRQRAIYEPGKSQVFMGTFCFEPKTNVRQRVGYFDSKDGIYLEHDGTQVSIVIRTTSSGTTDDTTSRVTQSNWNLDKFDGHGLSAANLDWTKSQILFMDMEWLGTGRVRVGFVIGGEIIYAHEFLHANVVDTTYMGHAALPMRYEIENTGTSASSTTLKSVCQTVMSEGGQNVKGIPKSETTGNDAVTVPTTGFLPLISIRLNSATRNSTFELLSAEILNTSNSFLQYEITLNPTLTSPSWGTCTDLIECDTSATALSGGTKIYSGFISGKSTPALDNLQSYLRGGFDINDTADIVTLSAKAIGSSCNVYGSLNWKEYY